MFDNGAKPSLVSRAFYQPSRAYVSRLAHSLLVDVADNRNILVIDICIVIILSRISRLIFPIDLIPIMMRELCVRVVLSSAWTIYTRLVLRLFAVANMSGIKPLRGQDQLLTMKCPFFQLLSVQLQQRWMTYGRRKINRVRLGFGLNTRMICVLGVSSTPIQSKLRLQMYTSIRDELIHRTEEQVPTVPDAERRTDV